MPATEHDLTEQVRRELKKRAAAGEPIHGRKIHGSVYMRDHPDWNIVYHGFAILLETKSPNPKSSAHGVTAGQGIELRNFQRAGALCVVARNIEEVRAALDRVAHYAQDLLDDPEGPMQPDWQLEPTLDHIKWMEK